MLHKSLKSKVQSSSRRKRINSFLEHLSIKTGDHVLDLGGHPNFWQHCQIPLKITLLNLASSNIQLPPDSQHDYTFKIHDIRKPIKITESVKCIFSNSVLEHVGNKNAQEEVAQNILETKLPFWVQIPNPYFPIEAHCMIPFWWQLPQKCRQSFLQHWERKGNNFLVNQMNTTMPIDVAELKNLFPNTNLHREKMLGFDKSFSVWKDRSSPRVRD